MNSLLYILTTGMMHFDILGCRLHSAGTNGKEYKIECSLQSFKGTRHEYLETISYVLNALASLLA